MGAAAHGGVRQDDDRGLQALRPVGGHHPHLAAGAARPVLLLAFDLDVAGRAISARNRLQVAHAAASSAASASPRKASSASSASRRTGRDPRPHRAASDVEPAHQPSIEIEAGPDRPRRPPNQQVARLALFRSLAFLYVQRLPQQSVAAGRDRRALLADVAERRQRGDAASVRSSPVKAGETAESPSDPGTRRGPIASDRSAPAHRRRPRRFRRPGMISRNRAPDAGAPENQRQSHVAAPGAPRHKERRASAALSITALAALRRCAPAPSGRRARAKRVWLVCASSRRCRSFIGTKAPRTSTSSPQRHSPNRGARLSTAQRRGPPGPPRTAARMADYVVAWVGGGSFTGCESRSARARVGIGEHGVDERQHLRRRAPAFEQLDTVETRSGRAGQALVGARLGEELLGCRALEGVDRLLLVADGEHRGRPRAAPGRAGSGEELLGQGVQHRPLVRRGVLSLVEQHMVDAAVELVQHPGRVGPLRQQLTHRLDQIAEVEPADSGPWRSRRGSHRSGPD